MRWMDKEIKRWFASVTQNDVSAEKKGTAYDQELSRGGGGATDLTKALYSHAPVVWAYTHA